MTEVELIIQPDADEPEAASVFVEGKLNGTAYRFLLDTGAARSNIVLDTVTAALAPVGTHTSSAVLSAAREEDLVEIERLEIGPIVQQQFTVTRSKAGPGTCSLIGMDILHSWCCDFRFDKNRLGITADSSDEAESMPLFMDKGFHPYIDVAFGSAIGNAVWDSGASLTVVNLGFIEAHPNFFVSAGHAIGTDATGSQFETPMYRMSGATMGGHHFPPHRVAAVDLSHINARIERPMDLILGYMTLRKANWCFDFPRNRWKITYWLGA